MDWFKKDKRDCTLATMQATVQEFTNTYRPDSVVYAYGGKFLNDETPIKVEVWINLNSAITIINVYNYVDRDEWWNKTENK